MNEGSITINGGQIITIGGTNGAGIGGGNNTVNATITIVGGEVKAEGGNNAAGIGGGKDGEISSNETAKDISIIGGTIIAAGGVNGAGIGGGAKGYVGNIIIGNDSTNVTVNATGGSMENADIGGAGIGGGVGKDGGTIIINNGNVTATGGRGAAGIGGGGPKINSDKGGDGGTIIINNGNIAATGNGGGAGIGGGRNGGAGGNVTIKNGQVTCNGNGGGAGIGGGSGGAGGNVTIENGQVTVKGSDGGAGIGGGSGGSEGETHITGGEVVDIGKVVPPEEEDNQKDTEKPSSQDPQGSGGSEGETDITGGEETDNGKVVPPEEEDDQKSIEKSSSGNIQNGNDSNKLSISLQGFGGDAVGGMCTVERQGALCVAAFKAATPVGFAEAFSFNLSLDATGRAKYNSDKKVGKFVLDIPAQYQNIGRIFAVIGIDKSGKTKLFYDTDLSDKTFTTNLDIEGYAFSLIYSDLTEMGNKTTTVSESANGTYVVKSGDSLSQIAARVNKSVKYLANKNGIEDVDRLSVGQVITY